MPGKLVIAATFSVRVGSRRVRFEISPAASHGGPEDAYRVRIDRRWHDLGGKPLFLRRPELAALLADYALEGIAEPAPAPEIPYPSRVTVEVWKDGFPCWLGAWTASPPILAHDGQWMGAVSYDGKVEFLPLKNVRISTRGRKHGQPEGASDAAGAVPQD